MELQSWYPSGIASKAEAVKAQLMLATTDARLAAAVKALMSIMNIAEPMEVLNEE